MERRRMKMRKKKVGFLRKHLRLLITTEKSMEKV